MSRRKIVIGTVVLACVLLAGCSRFTNAIRVHKAEDLADEFEAELDSDSSFLSVLENYSDVEIPDLLPEQRKIFDRTYETDVKIDLVEVADSGEKGTIKAIVYYHDPATVEDPDEFRTSAEWIAAIKEAEIKHINLDLKIRYVDDKWEFESFDDWTDAVMEPYSSLGILDDTGNPVNPNAGYFEKYVLDQIWYDPMLAIPLGSDSIDSPIALQCAFYFSEPISGTFKCVLRDPEGDKLGEAEAELKDSVIKIFDFSAETIGIKKFESGKYTMELLYNDEQIAVTEPLTVK